MRKETDYESGFVFSSDKEIDFSKITQMIWDSRSTVFKISTSFIFLGLFIALFSQTLYKTEAKLIPETQSSGGVANSLLQQYGGLLGINSGEGIRKEGTISPQLYPIIVESLPYQIELMNKPIYFSKYDTTVTPLQFFNKIYNPSVLDYTKEYTIGLPSKIINFFKNNEEEGLNNVISKVNRDSVLSLSKQQMEIFEYMRSHISISVTEETGILVFIVEFPDPYAAAEITREGINLLKEHVKEYRTQKARENLEFVQKQLNDAQLRFEEAQEKLAEFRDSNLNLATAKAQSREQELQSQYDLTFSLYNSLSQRQEQAKLELQEDTPVLSVLQPVNVPLEKSSPQRLLIVVVSLILGLLISVGWVMFKNWWYAIDFKLESKEVSI